ncbi:MAG: translation elongation factor 4 [Firmicutes bacterium]|nr:translation elongation factor 4 [Bacillota bacterium]
MADGARPAAATGERARQGADVGAVPPARIRNFAIIAHIDHGKSTLADRLLEYAGAVPAREMTEQFLDRMDLERERGITIKAQAVRLGVRGPDGEAYALNLIDTPGHVDFSYEVSRALAACEGVILVVDAAQGVQAQTVANLYLAAEHGLAIVPVLNKIDLPGADPERVRAELEDLGVDGREAIPVSAKTGEGVPEVVAAVLERVPPPGGDPDASLRALVFDSRYDPYMGVVCYVRIVDGSVAAGERVRFMATGRSFEVTEVGVFRPEGEAVERLAAGEVGYLTAGIKSVREARVGDTLTHDDRPADAPLPGFRPALPVVYAGLYPSDPGAYDDLREALERLQLNDAAIVYEPERSEALGMGFRVGFLGLLHLDVVEERLEREYGLDLVVTAPSVVYRVTRPGRPPYEIQSPADMPDDAQTVEEPFVEAEILVPADYVGAVMELCQERRGSMVALDYRSAERAAITYRMPLAEIVFDFYDRLKSRTRGYASLDYRPAGYEASDLVKVQVLLAGEAVDALSFVAHRSRAEARARAVLARLREVIPRQLFDVALQAAIGRRVIARETVRALRKDVLAKCYGGDVTRKRKLLEKQKAGKRRMREIGRVEVPQAAFMAVLDAEREGSR